MPYLTRLAARYAINFVCVDMKDHQEAKKQIVEQKLPYRSPGGIAYIKARNTLDKTFGTVTDSYGPIQGIIICTRPNSHFDIAKWAVNHGIPAFVEKPVVLPWQIKQMQNLYSRYPGLLYAADFFLDNLSVRNAAKKIHKIGKIQTIEGVLVESRPIEREREWLLKRKISGGGLGMDMLVHLIAIVEFILKQADRTKTLAMPEFTKAFFAKYKDAPLGEETYAQIHLRMQDIQVVFKGGKGVDRTEYKVIISGTKGSLEVNFGTEKTPSFLGFTDKKGVVYRQYAHEMAGYVKKDLGYYGTIEIFLKMMRNPCSIDQEELDFRMSTALLAVRLMNEAKDFFGQNGGKISRYTLGNNPLTASTSSSVEKEETVSSFIGSVSANKLILGALLIGYFTQVSSPVNRIYLSDIEVNPSLERNTVFITGPPSNEAYDLPTDNQGYKGRQGSRLMVK